VEKAMTINRRSVSTGAAAFAVLAGISSAGFAQERCATEAQQNIEAWANQNRGEIETLWERYDSSNDPDAEVVSYEGKVVPLNYALNQEIKRIQKEGRAVRDREIEKASECSGALEVALPRAGWDLAREPLTWVLPERATRIDFEEIRRGDVLGGKHAAIPKAARDVERELQNVERELRNLLSSW
jgi:hypothetical protein